MPDKYLIVQADDAGLSKSCNQAIIDLFEKGVITSSSIMVPCPYFEEIAAYAKQHPEFGWGVHLTLVAEWKDYKWSGVADKSKISSLLDKDGLFFETNNDLMKQAKVEEVKIEMMAQIDKALNAGIKLTHLDTHTGSLLYRPDLLDLYQFLSEHYNIPIFLPVNELKLFMPDVISHIHDISKIKPFNKFICLRSDFSAIDWHKSYAEELQNIRQGLNILVFHVATNNEEMKRICGDEKQYGAVWRQNDYDYARSADFKNALEKNSIKVISWAEKQPVAF